MRCFPSRLVAVMALGSCVAALAQTSTYNVGRTPSAEEIRAWDTSIGLEGKELPPGSGTAKEGAKLYAQKCAPCHGPTGTEGSPGVGMVQQRLVGGQGTLKDISPVKSVGSYYPFATPLWDYINCCMPENREGALSADEVYAVTAWILWRNGIIQENDVIDTKSLPKVQMPNRNGFVPPWPPKYKPGEKRLFGIYP